LRTDTRRVVAPCAGERPSNRIGPFIEVMAQKDPPANPGRQLLIVSSDSCDACAAVLPGWVALLEKISLGPQDQVTLLSFNGTTRFHELTAVLDLPAGPLPRNASKRHEALREYDGNYPNSPDNWTRRRRSCPVGDVTSVVVNRGRSGQGVYVDFRPDSGNGGTCSMR
jgi:hypothetical protein